MNMKRFLTSYGVCPTSRPEPSFIFLVVVVVVVIVLLSRDLYKEHPIFVCQSETSLGSEILNRTGVHVIPSIPKRQSWYEGVSQGHSLHREQEFNPYLSQCVDVQAPGKRGNLLICIHDPRTDQIVSGHLKSEGSWERENVETLNEAHQRFSSLVLVDLGCNIGVFTLAAAKLGMEVVAVDSMLDSLQLLQRSLHINGLSCHVTLIHNALHRKRMRMRVAVDPNNIGGSRVVEIPEFRRNKTNTRQLVDAICLDDLVPLVKKKTVFLKMDLESHEKTVLECADQFFQEVNVKIILLEWVHYRHNEEDSRFIKQFMEKHHMVPTWGLDINRDIDPFASNSWPDNVFWMKRL